MTENNPLSFEISAPGKVILHGEHSVVYGKTAIAGPIGLRTKAVFKESSGNKIILEFKSIPFKTTMTLENMNLFLKEFNGSAEIQPIDFLTRFRNDAAFILKYIDEKPKESCFKEMFCIGTTLYMFNRILLGERVEKIEKAFEFSIESDMSIGAGLGSSASYGVCTSASFYTYAQLLNGTISDLKDYSFNQNEILEKISKFAFDSEIVMHEKPSGIDNTICTYGKLVKFLRGQPPENIDLKKSLNIIIVDSGVSRTTAKLVAKVLEFKNKHSKLVDTIMDAMGYLVDDVVEILESNDSQLEDLLNLVSVNNNLLRALGVSHAKLEEIFRISEANGFQSKLTGAGGGGCALIFLPADYENMDEFKNLTKNLTEAKFSWMKTTIGGKGVEFTKLN